MALVQYYKQNPKSNMIDLSESGYASAHTMTMSIIRDLAIIDKEALSFFPNGIDGLKITAIIEELPEISYKTSWGDSPAAIINDKIQKFTQNKWIKMFAQQSANFRPPLLTDAWTQQVPKGAEPLSISLKFRAYPKNYYNTTSFTDIFRFLIFITTPKSFNMADTLGVFKIAYQEAYAKGQELASIVNDIVNQLSSNDGDSGKSSIDFKNIAAIFEQTNFNEETKKFEFGTEALKGINGDEHKFVNEMIQVLTFLQDLGNTKDDMAGGCPPIKLGINNFINGSSKINWLLKSWSFKPAMNITQTAGLNKPLYVDFNVSLQSQYIPSSNDILDLFNA